MITQDANRTSCSGETTGLKNASRRGAIARTLSALCLGIIMVESGCTTPANKHHGPNHGATWMKPDQRAEPPTGEWSGQGVYVDYEATAKEKLSDVTQSRAKDSVYKTALKISRQRICGHDTLVFDIRSKRGELFNLDDKASHVVFALVPLSTLEHGARLYAVAQWEYNPTPDRRVNEEEFNQQIRTASASCIRKGGATVLQVYYVIPSKDDPTCFFDTFVFEGNGVRKTGHVIHIGPAEEGTRSAEQKLASVYWVETLRKMK